MRNQDRRFRPSQSACNHVRKYIGAGIGSIGRKVNAKAMLTA
jgi:hypothetical protein